MPPKKSNKNKSNKTNNNVVKKPTPPKINHESNHSSSPASSVLDILPIQDDQDSAISIALSIGSKYSTITLLPTTTGQRGEIIANQDGDRCIPSMVSFMLDDATSSLIPCCGTSAKSQMLKYLNSTPQYFTHLIGLHSSDNQVLALGGDGLDRTLDVPTLIVESNDKSVVYKYTSEQLTSYLIGDLIHSAQAYTNKKVSSVVLSYPIDFSTTQQQALVRATESHDGVTVASLIPEPIAAVLAYEQYAYSSATKTATGLNGLVLSIDIGASSTTLCLMNACYGIYSTVHHQSFQLGGTDLDLILATYFNTDFIKSNPHLKQTPPLASAKSKLKLMHCAEDARKSLSNAITSNCHVEALLDGLDYACTMNRTRFESLCSKWKHQLRDTITAFFSMKSSSMIDDVVVLDIEEVDHVLCVGGVLSTPFVKSMVTGMFARAEIHHNELIDPNQAVAFGTAIHGVQDPAVHHCVPPAVDRTISAPHLKFPLGIEDASGHFITIIPRLSPIPVLRSVSIPLPMGLNSLVIRVSEGRHLFPVPNGSEDGDANEDDNDEEEAYPLYQGTTLGELVVSAKESVLGKLEVVFKVTVEAGVSNPAAYKLHVAVTGTESKSKQRVHASLEV